MTTHPVLALACAAALVATAPTARAQSTPETLAGWTAFGDVIAADGRLTLTTAYLDGDPAGDQPFNRSGRSAADIGTLEAAAGVGPYGLDPSASRPGTEGSLIRRSFSGIAGQTLRIDWSYDTVDPLGADSAFVVVDGTFATLATDVSSLGRWQSWRTTLTRSGPVTLAFGVIDTVDVAGVSMLTVGELAVVGAVPEPSTAALLLVGIAGIGGAMRVGRRQARRRTHATG